MSEQGGENSGYRNREGVLDEAEQKRQAALREGLPDVSDEVSVETVEIDGQRQELLRKLEQEQHPES